MKGEPRVPPHLRVLSAAHALAMTARLGRVDGARVDALCDSATGLPPDHPVRCMVEAFRLRQAQTARDPAALAEAGADLQRDVLRVLRPEPVDQHRMDIHG